MSNTGIDYGTIESVVGDFLLHSTHFGCLVVDSSGRIVLTNRTFLSIFPSLSKDQTGNPLHKVVHEQEKERVEGAVDYLFRNGKLAQSEWRLLSLAGEYFYVDIEASLFESGGQKYALGIFIDRTKQKSLEADLEEQSKSLKTINDQYELAIKTAKLGIWVYDINSDELRWNEEIRTMYGLSKEDSGIDLDEWRQFIHPEDLESTDRELAKAYAGDTVFNVRFRINTKEGRVRHISASAAPSFNEAGEVVKIHGVNYDITDLVEAEIEVSEREQLLRNITNQFPGFVVRVEIYADGTEHLLYISEGIRDIYGIAPKDAYNNFSLLWDRVCAEDIECIKKGMEESAEKLTSFSNKFCAIHLNGERKYLRGFSTPQKGNNGSVIWDTIVLDITEQKVKDKAIYESQRMLDRLTNEVPGMVYIYELLPDGSDRFEFLSEGIERLFGVNKQDALSDISIIWDRIHPEDVEILNNSIQESAKNLGAEVAKT